MTITLTDFQLAPILIKSNRNRLRHPCMSVLQNGSDLGGFFSAA
jgi:hypothetical protein